MKMRFREWIAAKNTEAIVEGFIDKFCIWSGLGASGIGLVTAIIGAISHNPALIGMGSLAAFAGSRATRSGFRGQESNRRSEWNEAVDNLRLGVANHPAVQREADKLGLSQEELVFLIDKIRRLLK